MTVNVPVFIEGIEEENKIFVETKDFDSNSKEAMEAMEEYKKLVNDARELGYEIVFINPSKNPTKAFRRPKKQ